MKRLMILTVSAVAVLAIAACGPSSSTRTKKKIGKTTLITYGNTQLACDIETMKEHTKMMMQMNKDPHHKIKMTGKVKLKPKHFVSLSIMDKAKKAPVKDAIVSYTVTGPDGKTESPEAHIMSGMGMHHYTAGFNTAKKGEYSIKANISINGKKYTETVKKTIK